MTYKLIAVLITLLMPILLYGQDKSKKQGDTYNTTIKQNNGNVSLDQRNSNNTNNINIEHVHIGGASIPEPENISVEYVKDTQGNVAALKVYPKQGVWQNPCLIIPDTFIKTNDYGVFAPFNMASMQSISFGNYMINDKKYECREVIGAIPCSAHKPYLIILKDHPPFFFFGDNADSKKMFSYNMGEISYSGQ